MQVRLSNHKMSGLVPVVRNITFGFESYIVENRKEGAWEQQMFTLKHPELMPAVKDLVGGLMSFIVADNDLPILVIKVPKEYILSSRINRFIKLYLVSIDIEGQRTFGLVTAFFDDDDEPLVVKTPLFRDSLIIDLLDLLSNEYIEIYFFDELSRERLVYRAKISVPEEAKKKMNEISLLAPSLPTIRKMIDQLDKSFGCRSSVDDEEAILIYLDESVYGEDIFIQDTRQNNHSYHGARGYSHTMLEREEPGSYQEEDIIQCLLLVFSPEQIYLSPNRVYDNEEMCDILVITDKTILIIQAKDSPNIERISKQKLGRKRKNVLSALKKAIKQVKGAIGYYRRDSGSLELLIDDERRLIATASLKIRSMIIVKELFDDQYIEYSTSILDIHHSKDVPCIPLDYPTFYQFCKNSPTEEDFFGTYDIVMSWAIERGQYPKPRFGLVK